MTAKGDRLTDRDEGEIFLPINSVILLAEGGEEEGDEGEGDEGDGGCRMKRRDKKKLSCT